MDSNEYRSAEEGLAKIKCFVNGIPFDPYNFFDPDYLLKLPNRGYGEAVFKHADRTLFLISIFQSGYRNEKPSAEIQVNFDLKFSYNVKYIDCSNELIKEIEIIRITNDEQIKNTLR